MTVLVDVGNTRLKWARLETGGKLVDSGRLVHIDGFEAAVRAMFDALPSGVRRTLVANVAGEANGQRLAQACQEKFGHRPEFVQVQAQAHGIRCAYEQPARLGVDRWVAMIGAYARVAGAVCVIDAGTTVTFDAVDAQGNHLGGLIFPGPRMVSSVLQRNTQGIGATPGAGARPRGLDVLGRETDTAVSHGAMLSVSAALREALRTVAAALGATPACMLTGGDGPQLQAWLETEVQTRADLVLEGLAFIAGQGG